MCGYWVSGRDGLGGVKVVEGAGGMEGGESGGEMGCGVCGLFCGMES